MRRSAAVLLLLAAPAAAQERLGWEAAARACLEGDARSFVTFHAALPDGASRLLMHRPDGTRVSCEIGPDGRVRQRSVVASDAYAPPADAPAFFLERRCVDARRIDAPDGRVLGWRAYPGC
jgi:hypothetical protein